MNHFKKSLMLATVALSTLSFNAQTADATAKPANMAHYIFTYNVNKTQDPVIHLTRQTQQFIEHGVALDVQSSAYGTIYSITDDLGLAANLPAATYNHNQLQVAE